MEKSFSVGLIGAGRIGKIHIENLLYRIPNINLKYVVDNKIDEKMKNWAEEMGVPNLIDDPNHVFNDEEIDVVIICSPTDTHIKFIQNAAVKHKHVFCEKPFDTDINRINETIKIVKQNGVKLMIGFNRRFDRNFKRVHELISSGEIGTPQIVKITSRDPVPPPIDYIKVSGGIFLDMSIHDWDMARFQCNSEVEEVYATGSVLIDKKIGEAGDIDTAATILKFENGAIGIIDNIRQAVYGYDQRVEVLGSQGCLIADNEATNTVSIYNTNCKKLDKIPSFFMERYMDSYYAELKYFFECIAKNEDPEPSGEDGLKDVLIALSAQKSFEENRPIKISDIKN